jgi:hypothetical protein
VDALAALLSREPEIVKHELQKRITSLTLTPQVTDGVRAYLVSGDVGLFSGTEDVVQTNQVDLISLHYQIPISFSIQLQNKTRQASAKAA